MEIYSSVLGAIVLVFLLIAFVEVAKGPNLNAPLLRRKFFKQSVSRLLGTMFAVIVLLKLFLAAIEAWLQNSAWAAGSILFFWAALSCTGLWFVRRSISRLRSELT